ncbi:MAG: hypothetical protein ACK4OE_14725 [Acidovorax sp.]|uniref:hypothetical protein n=1 Tax=Acidovorax sp. TaxID=1872122 RepID=UPI00391B4D2D
MDALIDLLMLLIFHWRLGLSVLGTLAVAIFLAAWIPWFTGAFGLAMVIASAGAGVWWEAGADRRRMARIAAGK